MNIQHLIAVSAIGLTLGLSACSGKAEANEMTKFANEMCACKTVECADKLFPRIEKMTEANAGKQVEANAAAHYNRELDRTQGCYDKLHEGPSK